MTTTYTVAEPMVSTIKKADIDSETIAASDKHSVCLFSTRDVWNRSEQFKILKENEDLLCCEIKQACIHKVSCKSCSDWVDKSSEEAKVIRKEQYESMHRCNTAGQEACMESNMYDCLREDLRYYCYRWYADALTFLSDRKIDTDFKSPIRIVKDEENGVIVEVVLQDDIDFIKLKEHMQNYYNEQDYNYPGNITDEEKNDAANELDKIILAMQQAKADGFDYITLEAE